MQGFNGKFVYQISECFKQRVIKFTEWIHWNLILKICIC